MIDFYVRSECLALPPRLSRATLFSLCNDWVRRLATSLAPLIAATTVSDQAPVPARASLGALGAFAFLCCVGAGAWVPDWEPPAASAEGLGVPTYRAQVTGIVRPSEASNDRREVRGNRNGHAHNLASSLGLAGADDRHVDARPACAVRRDDRRQRRECMRVHEGASTGHGLRPRHSRAPFVLEKDRPRSGIVTVELSATAFGGQGQADSEDLPRAASGAARVLEERAAVPNAHPGKD